MAKEEELDQRREERLESLMDTLSQHVGIYVAVVAVIFGAVAQGSQLCCKHVWVPLVATAVATVAFTVSVARIQARITACSNLLIDSRISRRGGSVQDIADAWAREKSRLCLWWAAAWTGWCIINMLLCASYVTVLCFACKR